MSRNRDGKGRRNIGLSLFLVIVPYSKTHFVFLPQILIVPLLCSEPVIKHKFTMMNLPICPQGSIMEIAKKMGCSLCWKGYMNYSNIHDEKKHEHYRTMRYKLTQLK